MSKRKNNSQVPSKAASLETRALLLRKLNITLDQLYNLYHTMVHPETEIYEGWTAKDILGHITFWHESFARNVSALAEGREPIPLKGKYVDLNQRSVEETRTLTTAQIMGKLQVAHQIIQENILSEKLELIPYRKGSREYTPEEHLDIVNRHILEHLKSVERLRRTAQKEIN